MTLLLTLILTPIVLLLGLAIIVSIYLFVLNKFGSAAAKVVVVIIIAIFFSYAINDNIQKSNERNAVYDEYRKSTNKTYMSDSEVDKAMMDEAKFKYEMEKRIKGNN